MEHPTLVTGLIWFSLLMISVAFVVGFLVHWIYNKANSTQSKLKVKLKRRHLKLIK